MLLICSTSFSSALLYSLSLSPMSTLSAFWSWWHNMLACYPLMALQFRCSYIILMPWISSGVIYLSISTFRNSSWLFLTLSMSSSQMEKTSMICSFHSSVFRLTSLVTLSRDIVRQPSCILGPQTLHDSSLHFSAFLHKGLMQSYTTLWSEGHRM